jgi:hypothetical protein
MVSSMKPWAGHNHARLAVEACMHADCGHNLQQGVCVMSLCIFTAFPLFLCGEAAIPQISVARAVLHADIIIIVSYN